MYAPYLEPGVVKWGQVRQTEEFLSAEAYGENIVLYKQSTGCIGAQKNLKLICYKPCKPWNVVNNVCRTFD